MTQPFALDGFEPIKRIGGGGFGDVWLARQTNVDRKVAIKVGHAPIQEEIIRVRFERECKALGRLSGHPNIVDVFTAGSLDDERPYLVLEYIDGGTLWRKLKNNAIQETELIKIGLQISAALKKAHGTGVLHRDLKPENILMRSSGDAVLGDFGIARLQDGANTTSAAITASVAYAAPEVLSGKKASVASDLYGVGICLLAAIIRSVPFVESSDDSIHPIINRVLEGPHVDSRNFGISEELAATIDWILAKKPNHRPDSAAELHHRFKLLDQNQLIDGYSRSAAPISTRIPEHATATSATTVTRPVVTGSTAPPSHQVRPHGREPMLVNSTFDSPAHKIANKLHLTNRIPLPSIITSTTVMRAFAFGYATTVVLGGALVFLLSAIF